MSENRVKSFVYMAKYLIKQPKIKKTLQAYSTIKLTANQEKSIKYIINATLLQINI